MTLDPTLALPLLRALAGAVSIRAIYPPDHPRVREGVDSLVESLESCLRELDQEDITLLVIDEELLVDDRPIRARSMHFKPIVRTLNGRGVERLTLAFGLGREEGHELVEGLAGGENLDSSEHVVLGRVQLGEAADGEGMGSRPMGLPGIALSEEDVDRAEDSFIGIRSDGEGSIERLDQILWRFVEGMEQTSRSLLLLAPMRSYDQELFVHSINVALLTLAQARSLGLSGQALHDIGLAAMLHDIGKMSLPPSLWAKRGRYSEREWEVIKQHPELGAARLCGLQGVPPLAVLVAYEHHMRWDGKESYPVPSRPRIPNLASQLTSIANTYDTMIASRGLSIGPRSQEALGIWREHSATLLDPFLVGNFVLLMSEADSL